MSFSNFLLFVLSQFKHCSITSCIFLNYYLLEHVCSEMGAHFSPCGRFLAACVACMQPHWEADPGLQGHTHHNNTGAVTSPTQHPILAHQVIYELRIYSLEEAT